MKEAYRVLGIWRRRLRDPEPLLDHERELLIAILEWAEGVVQYSEVLATLCKRRADAITKGFEE